METFRGRCVNLRRRIGVDRRALGIPAGYALPPDLQRAINEVEIEIRGEMRAAENRRDGVGERGLFRLLRQTVAVRVVPLEIFAERRDRDELPILLINLGDAQRAFDGEIV